MGHTVSALWQELMSQRGTSREYKFVINGVEYGKEAEVTHSVSGGLFEEFGIGRAVCATMSLTLYADSIPRAARIERYIRLRRGDTVSEWIPKGVFFVNRRSDDDGLWTLEAFDGMKKADVMFLSTGDVGTWPRSAADVVDEIAERMGVELDPRTVIDSSVMVSYPNDNTMWKLLQDIATAHVGNWVMSDEGKLWLVPLLSAPEETHYLVTQTGQPITIGGVRILV